MFSVQCRNIGNGSPISNTYTHLLHQVDNLFSEESYPIIFLGIASDKIPHGKDRHAGFKHVFTDTYTMYRIVYYLIHFSGVCM